MTDATNGDKRVQIILIHGGFHGVWVWEKVVDRLAELGWPAQTVALPSVAAKDQPRYGMHDDAVAVRRRLEIIEDPVVVVAHSYGGVVATQAAAGLKNVAHIIYLAAFQLDVGDSLLGVVGEPAPWWIVEDDMLSAGRPFETFFSDVSIDDATRAIDRLQPSSYSTVTEQLTEAAWRGIESTYVICDEDQALPAAAQVQMAKRATHVRRMPSSHSPMLSRPAEVALIIADTATQVLEPW
ncbi:alpha/beta hydrolase [Mycobacterium montefiorense]|nr:alpha/beta hydrolase [Mycobacterium montefiorense]